MGSCDACACSALLWDDGHSHMLPKPRIELQTLQQGVLSKLSAAKELMGEIMEREKRKQLEREAAKSADAKAAKEEAPSNVTA